MEFKDVLNSAAKPPVEKKQSDDTVINFRVTHAQKGEFNRLIQALGLDRNKTLAGTFRALLDEMQQAEQRGKK
jgi:hypothetical protein